MLGKENVKIKKDQMSEIITLLRKEEAVHEQEEEHKNAKSNAMQEERSTKAEIENKQ